MPRRFKSRWTAEHIPGGYVVKDATGQAPAYVYASETRADADTVAVHGQSLLVKEHCIRSEFEFLVSGTLLARGAIRQDAIKDRR